MPPTWPCRWRALPQFNSPAPLAPFLALQDSDDITYMIGALKVLGVQLEQHANGDMTVHGCGGRFAAAGAELFLGNAGTAMRPLTAAVVAAGRGR